MQNNMYIPNIYVSQMWGQYEAERQSTVQAKIVKAIGNFFKAKNEKEPIKVLRNSLKYWGMESTFMESLILAQDERWRRA